MVIRNEIKTKILEKYQQLKNAGNILPIEKIEDACHTFKEKFGPEALSGINGENLLNRMHDLPNHDSLVYWLEYKNDEEFPGIFGSIAGGSGLKYGIFKRKETGIWTTGTPQQQQDISVEQAVVIAQKHRDELIAGCKILTDFPEESDKPAYEKLQNDLERVAPSVCNTSWGHKYFALINPTKIDDIHNPGLGRFHLIKLLITPPEGDGRYLTASSFTKVAKELQIPLIHLTGVLYELNGSLHRYWRVGTKEGGTAKSFWEDMKKGSFVSIGWSAVGDLTWVEYNQESKDKLSDIVGKFYEKKNTQKIFNFVTAINLGDIVLAGDGSAVLGIGRVTGGYTYDPSSDFAHRRSVNWLSFETKSLNIHEMVRSAFYEVKKPENLIEIEKALLAPGPKVISGPVNPSSVRLEGIAGEIQSILERKKQVILYGPPGTGKTFWATKTACNLAAISKFGKQYNELSSKEQNEIIDGPSRQVYKCTFHPAYGYEDFLEGYRPLKTDSGQLAFELRNGIFKRLCQNAQNNPDTPFYLVIDEINRGDIPRIFGELITLLEYDKRGQSTMLPLSGESFSVPEKVFVIGTMNTADRSIALLDTALRRRFGFVELMPDTTLLNVMIENFPLGSWLEALNEKILSQVGKDSRNLQIGHAFFLDGGKPVSDKSKFIRILKEDIIPLLEEYCYEDYQVLGNILGTTLVDIKRQRIKNDLLDINKWESLLTALLGINTTVTTSSQTISAENQSIKESEEESDNG